MSWTGEVGRALRSGSRTRRYVVAATVAAGTLVTAGLPVSADARVHGCGPSVHGTYPGRILSVRNMTCHGALRVYTRNKGWEHVPLAKGRHTRIGRFRCHVYKDLTPPMSDSWVFIRCVHGGRAFRLEYGL